LWVSRAVHASEGMTSPANRTFLLFILLATAACGGVSMDAPDGAPTPDGPPAPECTLDDQCASGRCGDDGACVASCGVGGIVAYYPFDGDTMDHSGRGHDVGASDVTPTDGVLGGAYAFDGQSPEMWVTGEGELAARTLCAWVQRGEDAGFGLPVFTGGSPGRGDFFSLDAGPSICPGDPERTLFVDHWGVTCYSGVTAVPLDRWSLVCFGSDNAGLATFFVDGNREVAAGETYTYALATLTIGSNAIGGSTTAPAFAGAIDEVTIWDHALDAVELAALWNDGHGCVP
jgi:hypothetical protein